MHLRRLVQISFAPQYLQPRRRFRRGVGPEVAYRPFESMGVSTDVAASPFAESPLKAIQQLRMGVEEHLAERMVAGPGRRALVQSGHITARTGTHAFLPGTTLAEARDRH